jgi:hypothetical protein
MRLVTAGALVVAMTMPAAAKSNCTVTFATKGSEGSVAGKVSKIDTPKDGPSKVHIDGASEKLDFTFGVSGTFPFAVGDVITVSYSCGGWGNHCDARIDDANGDPIVIYGGFGSDKLATGWSFAVGKVLSRRQDPNQSEKSIEKYHELTLGKTGTKTTWSLAGSKCTTVKDGKTTWYATGGARTWEGVRPPEGVDFQWYTLVRKR